MSEKEASNSSGKLSPKGQLHLSRPLLLPPAGEASLLMQTCTRVATKLSLKVRGSSSVLIRPREEKEGPAPEHPEYPGWKPRPS